MNFRIRRRNKHIDFLNTTQNTRPEQTKLVAPATLAPERTLQGLVVVLVVQGLDPKLVVLVEGVEGRGGTRMPWTRGARGALAHVRLPWRAWQTWTGSMPRSCT